MAFIEVILVIATAIFQHTAPPKPVHPGGGKPPISVPDCEPTYEQGQGGSC